MQLWAWICYPKELHLPRRAASQSPEQEKGALFHCSIQQLDFLESSGSNDPFSFGNDLLPLNLSVGQGPCPGSASLPAARGQKLKVKSSEVLTAADGLFIR